jgi:transposase InsO family protein
MGLSRAVYYYEPFESSKEYSDFEVRDMIEKIHQEFPAYGYRRVYHHLLRQDIRINGKRIKRIMKEFELFTCLKKWMRPRGTHSSVKLCYPNISAGMKLTGPNQVWATDFTYIKLRYQFVYLSAVLDIYTRKIVGWSLSESLTHEFCLEAIKSAVQKEKPPKGLVHHSDRGIQYVCEPYIKFLLENEFEISMSRPGVPEENAFIESFFKTLKKEEVYVRKYQTINEVINNVPKFIEEVYNKKRLHSSLGYMSPEEYECKILKLKNADRPVQRICSQRV